MNIHRFAVLPLLLVGRRGSTRSLVASVAAHEHGGHDHGHAHHGRRNGGRDLSSEEGGHFACGFRHPSPEEDSEIEQEIRAHRAKKEKEKEDGFIRHLQDDVITVEVYFHVVCRNDGTGCVTDQMINDQMTVLTESFDGSESTLDVQLDCNGNRVRGQSTPFRFNLAGITRTVNNAWFSDYKYEMDMKEELRVGSCDTLNIYTMSGDGSDGFWYGWADFPRRCENNPIEDGVVLAYDTLPNSGGPYDFGDTCVHEVGHWLGLYHTFEGGCSGEGDMVNDTPAEKNSNNSDSCNTNRDTCPNKPGNDPVTNFMDYSADCCSYTFSPGQVERMINQVELFRSLTFGPPQTTSTSSTATTTTITTATGASGASRVTYDFSGSMYDDSVWSEYNPNSIPIEVSDGRLTFRVPAKKKYEVSFRSNGAPRLYIAHPDEEGFTIEAKFLSLPLVSGQMEGLYVRGQGNNELLRFSSHNDFNWNIQLYSGYINVASSLTKKTNREIVSRAPDRFKLVRVVGDGTSTYQFYVANPGEDYVLKRNLSHGMVVTGVGFFGGSKQPRPGFDAAVDYVTITKGETSQEEPSKLPTKAPTKAPLRAPTHAPTKSPADAPTKTPTTTTTTTTTSTVPETTTNTMTTPAPPTNNNSLETASCTTYNNFDQFKNAVQSLPNGGTLVVCPGSTMTASSTIIVQNKVHLYCQTGEPCTIQGGTRHFLIKGADGQLTLENFTLQGATFQSVRVEADAIKEQRFVRCTFQNNVRSGPNGGAIFGEVNTNILVDSCTFQQNYANYYGSAIYMLGSALHITDCIFRENYGAANGDALLYPGAVSIDDATTLFVQDTAFIDNSGGVPLHITEGGQGSWTDLGGNTATGNDACNGIFRYPAALCVAFESVSEATTTVATTATTTTTTTNVTATEHPTMAPTNAPTKAPTDVPTGAPTNDHVPSSRASTFPSANPSPVSSTSPSATSSSTPSSASARPSKAPTDVPTGSPTDEPSIDYSHAPSSRASTFPSAAPSSMSSTSPSATSSSTPSSASSQPSKMPSINPSRMISASPSSKTSSTMPSFVPSSFHSSHPSMDASISPSATLSSMPPSATTIVPSGAYTTIVSSVPSPYPSTIASELPSLIQTSEPNNRLTETPSTSGTPSTMPSILPSSSKAPSFTPSTSPSASVVPSSATTATPSTGNPTDVPTKMPRLPTALPTKKPTDSPTNAPTTSPTEFPTKAPTNSSEENPLELASCTTYTSFSSFQSDADSLSDGGVLVVCAGSNIIKPANSRASIDKAIHIFCQSGQPCVISGTGRIFTVATAAAEFTLENFVLEGATLSAVRITSSTRKQQRFLRCIFQNHVKDGRGAAILSDPGTDTYVDSCTFRDNYASRGPAIFSRGAKLTIIKSFVERNGGKNAVIGTNMQTDVIVQGSRFVDNTGGPPLYVTEGGDGEWQDMGGNSASGNTCNGFFISPSNACVAFDGSPLMSTTTTTKATQIVNAPTKKPTSRPTTESPDSPQLSYVRECSNSNRCGLCEGDCDNDKQCGLGLVCFQRSGIEAVPGCRGAGLEGYDYCHRAPPNVLHHFGDCTDSEPCGRCEGDCDSDDQCLPGLKCFQREGLTNVPGCDGEGRSYWDYCYEPISFPNALSLSDSSCSSSSPCGKCEGNCSGNDSKCKGSLACFQRAGSEAVPGCVTGGSGDVYGLDYCHEPSLNGPVTYIPGDLRVTESGHDLLLSAGLTARIIATKNTPVKYTGLPGQQESSVPFHTHPDGGAVFADEDTGGWVYVSNSEATVNGGVGSISFDANGEVIKYERILSGTIWNCGGGKTPWGTWLSCEETDDGQVWEVDPFGKSAPKKTLIGGEGGAYESAAYDMRDPNNPTFYVTHDASDGAMVRFTPDSQAVADALSSGDFSDLLHVNPTGSMKLEWLMLVPNPSDNNRGSFYWSSSRLNADANAARYYPSSEGIDIRHGKVYFTCKSPKHLFILDLDSMTYERSSTVSGAFDNQPDQIASILGDNSDEDILYFCEDGGSDNGVHGRDSQGNFYSILDGTPYDTETTGLAFSPDKRHMYVSFQGVGHIFDIRRTDGYPFGGQRLDIKYHDHDYQAL